MSGIDGDSATIGAGTIGRSGTIRGKCCGRRSGAARNRTTYRPMSGRGSGIRRTGIIGRDVADADSHACGDTDAQMRFHGRCCCRHTFCAGADDECGRDARRTIARTRESRPEDSSILRPVWLWTHSLWSAPPRMALGPMGLPLSARLPDRLLLCMPDGSARLRPMRLLAVPALLTTAPRSERPPPHCSPTAASLR